MNQTYLQYLMEQNGGKLPSDAASALLFAGQRNANANDLGIGPLSNEMLYGARKQGLRPQDMGKNRWKNGKWVGDDGTPYVSPYFPFNYGGMQPGSTGPKSMGAPLTPSNSTSSGEYVPTGGGGNPIPRPGGGGNPIPRPGGGGNPIPRPGGITPLPPTTTPPPNVINAPQLNYLMGGQMGFVPGFGGAVPGAPLSPAAPGPKMMTTKEVGQEAGWGDPGAPTGNPVDIKPPSKDTNPFSWSVWTPGDYASPQFNQTYGGKPSPYASLNDQIAGAFGGFNMFTPPAWTQFGMFGNQGASINSPFTRAGFSGNQFVTPFGTNV